MEETGQLYHANGALHHLLIRTNSYLMFSSQNSA
jgi:hypothetical protein